MAEEQNVATTTEPTSANTEPQVDYKALFEAESAKNKKLKGQVDDYSSQIAEHKRKDKEKLSEEERKQQEQEERDKKFADMQKELIGMKARNAFADKGFKSDEYEPILEALVDNNLISSENCQVLPEKIAELVNNRVELAKELVKNDMTANNTQHPQSTETAKDSGFKSYQNKKLADKNNGIVKL